MELLAKIWLVSATESANPDTLGPIGRAGLNCQPLSWEQFDLAVRDQSPGSAAWDGVVLFDLGSNTPAIFQWLQTVRNTTAKARPTVGWVVDEEANFPIESDGDADFLLFRPFPARQLVATLRQAIRQHQLQTESETALADCRQIGSEFRGLLAEREQLDRLARTCKRLSFPGHWPESATVELAAHHRAQPKAAGILYQASRLEGQTIGFWLAAPGGTALAGWLRAGAMTNAIYRMQATLKPPAPAAVLAEVNRVLLELDDPSASLAGLIYGTINEETGQLSLSRGGMPAPIWLGPNGNREIWHDPAPFLGVFQAEFGTRTIQLNPGERLVLRAGPTPPDADPFPAAAVRHYPLRGTDFVHAVAKDVGLLYPEEDELTVVAVQFQ